MMGGTHIRKYWNRTCGRSVSSSSPLSKLDVKVFVDSEPLASCAASNRKGFDEYGNDFVLGARCLLVVRF